uniref:uncharacterized protein LOC120345010 n=1 Tax=Styela clava TaxID=7725 RepID=UPI00193A3046|nr:uncharacterized protein LOC120345010 [Styela clava]
MIFRRKILDVLVLCMFVRGTTGLSIKELGIFEVNGIKFAFDNDNLILTSSNGTPPILKGIVFNNIKPVSVKIEVPFQPSVIPVNPKICLPPGIIGLTITGIPIYNPYTSDCCNAALVEKNKLDGCWGNMDENNQYYYNTPPLCTFKNVCNESQLIGVALDGFPIYGPFDEQGVSVDSSSLDECNGREDARRGYRYHIVNKFPYTIGCFRGPPTTPTACGCGTLAPTCSDKPDTQIVKMSCCANEASCNYILNEDYSSVHSVTYGRKLCSIIYIILIQLCFISVSHFQ